MTPIGHLVLSGGAGALVAATTGTAWPLVAAIGAGVLVDADHAVDYYYWFVRNRRDRVFYLLHGWEYLALLFFAAHVLTWNPLVLGAAVGYSTHLLGDQFANRAYPLTYSLVYRVSRGFLIDQVSRWVIDSPPELSDFVPLGHRIVAGGRWMRSHFARRGA